MRASNNVRAGVVAIGLVVLLAGAASGCPSVSSFNMLPQPGAGPTFPAPPSLGKLEIFLSANDLFRDNEIEGYNIRLKRFSDGLELIDADAREAGSCTQREYRAFKLSYIVEHNKVANEYFEPYRTAMNVYRANVRLYKVTHDTCVWNKMNGRDGCE